MWISWWPMLIYLFIRKSITRLVWFSFSCICFFVRLGCVNCFCLHRPFSIFANAASLPRDVSIKPFRTNRYIISFGVFARVCVCVYVSIFLILFRSSFEFRVEIFAGTRADAFTMHNANVCARWRCKWRYIYLCIHLYKVIVYVVFFSFSLQ